MGFIPLSSRARTYPTAFTAVEPSERHVSFTPTVRVTTVVKLSNTPEEKGRLYHTKAELNGFYQDVKEFYASHPDRPGTTSSSSSPACPPKRRREVLVRQDADPNIRGLELFFYPTRVQNKSLTRKSLRKHYNDLNVDTTLTEEQRVRSLAAMSSKLSYWSKLVAAETARLDSIRAYGSPDPHMYTEERPDDDSGMMPLKQRTVSFDDEDSDGEEPSAKRRR